MELINELFEMVEEEIADAKKYAQCAIKKKARRPGLATMFAKLSEEEIGHANQLNAQINNLMQECSGKISEKQSGVYEYLQERNTECLNEVKVMLGLFKDNK